MRHPLTAVLALCSLLKIPNSSRDSGSAFPELLHQVLASAQAECQDRKRSGLVCAVQKNAGVTDVEIRNIVRLSKAVSHKFVGIIAHAKRSGLVQAVARRFRMLAHSPN